MLLVQEILKFKDDTKVQYRKIYVLNNFCSFITGLGKPEALHVTWIEDPTDVVTFLISSIHWGGAVKKTILK